MIQFFAEEISLPNIDQDKYSEWLQSAAKEESKELENINYIFCSDEYLLKINQEHLKHDYYTDIITFPLNYDPIVSDIFISLDRVNENAKDHDINPTKELLRVMVHGLLHMMGYDDKDDQSKSIMRSKEDYYIEQFMAKT